MSNYICTSAKIRFSDTTNRWKVTYTFESNPGHVLTSHYRELSYSSHTITKNNKTYRYLSDFSRGAWIYEDTVANIIYGINCHEYYPNGDTNEYVIFDYNLKTGDTFTAAIQVVSQAIPTTAKCVVTNVDSIMLNNYWHKRFYLDYFQGSYKGVYIFVEGIGIGRPLLTLTGPCSCTYSGYYNAGLVCFHQAGKVPETDTGKLYGCDVTLNLSTIKNNTVQLYPQPATTIANVQLPQKLHSGSIAVFNQLGQVVHTEAINSKELLEIHNTGRLHGLYYYRITDNTENKVYSGKILFE